jgi:hypothetical protein
VKEDLLPSQLASASFRLSKYQSIRWAEDIASALEQVVKPAPTRGGEAEIADKEGVICTLTGCCSAALDGSPSVDFLQIIMYQHIS